MNLALDLFLKLTGNHAKIPVEQLGNIKIKCEELVGKVPNIPLVATPEALKKYELDFADAPFKKFDKIKAFLSNPFIELILCWVYIWANMALRKWSNPIELKNNDDDPDN